MREETELTIGKFEGFSFKTKSSSNNGNNDDNDGNNKKGWKGWILFSCVVALVASVTLTIIFTFHIDVNLVFDYRFTNKPQQSIERKSVNH